GHPPRRPAGGIATPCLGHRLRRLAEDADLDHDARPADLRPKERAGTGRCRCSVL
ncbi:MAG: hypothetical protein AVDCRST_MAG75-5, partial [uncultured Propionibacteriaceae bacterium]